MEAKLGAPTFPQRDINVREKSTGKQTTDPLQMKKEFGGKNLSQILNEVADPNYKASTRKVRGVGNSEMGKDAFFKLMLTQLKQQDPTNPMKSHEMAAQLAQFSSVEQLANVNETLTKMSQKDQNQGKYDVLSLIGKMVKGDSSKIDRFKGDKDHRIEFSLPKGADRVAVKIKDAKGIVVKKYELKDLKQGRNQLIWNGMHDDGKDARVGQYSAEIDAYSQGRKVVANTEFAGAVEGVQFTGKGPVLIVDGKTLPLKDVRTIQEPKVKSSPVQANVMNPNQKVSKGAFEQKEPLANLDTAQMSKELRNRLTGKNKLAMPKQNLVTKKM